MELVRTTGSCFGIPIKLFLANFFWSCLLIGIVLSIGFCPDLWIVLGNCFNSLSVVWYILIGMVRTIDWCSDFPICFWSCLIIGMVLAIIGVCPGLPIEFFFSICFVSCLLMEMVHTIGSCCDLPIEIVTAVSIICFWSWLWTRMGRTIDFCPDLLNA